MRHVEVDFSSTVRGGLIRAHLRRFHGAEVIVGEAIEAFDDDEGLMFSGVVDHIDGDFAYLRMDWTDAQPASPMTPTPGTALLSFAGSAATFAATSATQTLALCGELTA